MIKYDSTGFNPSSLDNNDIDKIQLSMIPERSRVLEIGCATGFMSEYLKIEKNCFVYGVENNIEQAYVAKDKCDFVLNGSIDDKNIQHIIDEYINNNYKFDVIFMSQVVEHIAYPNDVLVKLKDWLKDQGILVISTVNIAHWLSRVRLLFGKWKYEQYGLFDNTHLRFFSVDGFEDDLINAGYRVVDEGYNIHDFTIFFMIPKFKNITPGFFLNILPFFGKKLFKWYCKHFRNIIAYQFVFKAIVNKGNI